VGAWVETEDGSSLFQRHIVAPLVGAWVETLICLRLSAFAPSRPSWARGLKPCLTPAPAVSVVVAPIVGAWVETCGYALNESEGRVAPLVGA